MSRGPHRIRAEEWIESGLLELTPEQILVCLQCADQLDSLEPVFEAIEAVKALSTNTVNTVKPLGLPNEAGRHNESTP